MPNYLSPGVYVEEVEAGSRPIEGVGTAVRFAARALLEGPLPELEGADHYHTTSVSPGWAPAMDRVRRIDDHVFYVDPRSSSPL